MKVSAFVGELNPFHQGHKKLIQVMQKSSDLIVCAMSGPFVQRGSPAILSKWTRAKIAVENGVDLVLEIPQFFVLQQSSIFALGSIATLSLIPEIDELFFGAEKHFFEINPEEILQQLKTPEIQEKISLSMKEGSSYRRAISKALNMSFEANEILALSYLQAIKQLHLNWKVHPILREGADHHDLELKSSFPSASSIRKALMEGRLVADDLLGEKLISEEEKTALEKASYSANHSFFSYLKYRSILDPLDFRKSPHFEKGMDDRIRNNLYKAKSLEELICLSSNKRQSKSRYRRLIITSLLGIEKKPLPRPGYIRPLAFSSKGATLLKEPSFPVVQKLADRKLTDDQEKLLQIDLKAQRAFEEIWALSPGQDYRQQFLQIFSDHNY